MTGRLQVGFLGGTRLAGNVRTLLSNLRRLLATRDREFVCELVVSEGVDTPEGYDPVRVTHPSVETARDRLRVLTRAVRQYARARDPDVLFQVTRFPTHGPAVALAGRVTRTPTVARLAGDNFREYRFADGAGETVQTYLLKNGIALAAVHLPDAVVVLGPTGRGDVETRGRRTGVWELPQPVDREQFGPGSSAEARESLGLDPDRKLLLTVGRISRRKGAATIRRVAPQVDAEWVVVGDGPMRDVLSGVPTVHTPGRVPYDAVVDYYRAADLYVHPSHHEGLPNVLLEATACGTPSVARDVGECGTVARETFEDDQTLPSLLDRGYDAAELDERFDEDRLAAEYDSLLTEVAG